MIIGIDIGTSYSSVAILKDGKAKEIKPPTENSASIPSAVFVKDDGTLLIGRPAVATRMTDPSCFKDNFKREFGTDKPFPLGDKELTPDEIYVVYFKSFMESVKSFTGKDVTKAYITHPAGYSPKKKKLLEKAARFAGLSNIELLDEPTAAALSYFSDHMPRSGETLLVYDLGGGTFDLTLVEMTENGFRLLTDPVGDPRLGGADFDQILYDDIIAEFSKEHDLAKALENDRFRFQIREAAVNAKINLSSDTSALVSVPYGFGEFLEYKITREHFNKLIESKVRHSCTLIEKIAKNAGLTPAQIDKVLCVGGSTRIPFVIMCVEETVCKPALRTADPELAICLGAVLKEVVKSEAVLEPGQEPMHSQNSNPAPPPTDFNSYNLNANQIIQDDIKKNNKQDSKQPASKTVPRSPQELYEKGLEYSNIENDSEAVKWYLDAAHQGFAPAQSSLGLMYEVGKGIEQDFFEAVKWYRKAAEQGHSEAQSGLGLMYYHGFGVAQSDVVAAEWFEKAALQGDSDAQAMLDEIKQKAEEAAKQGHKRASKNSKLLNEENKDKCGIQSGHNTPPPTRQHEQQLNLSPEEMFYRGSGYHEAYDFTNAEKWFRMAAEGGNSTAQYKLGFMYANGQGIPKDYDQAIRWLSMSAVPGKRSQWNLDILNKIIATVGRPKASSHIITVTRKKQLFMTYTADDFCIDYGKSIQLFGGQSATVEVSTDIVTIKIWCETQKVKHGINIYKILTLKLTDKSVNLFFSSGLTTLGYHTEVTGAIILGEDNNAIS